MKKIISFVIVMMTFFYASAQTCPGTLANQTTTTDPFFKIDQGTTDCVDWPMTITIDGSVFQQTSCSGANLQYTLISGPALMNPDSFVANFGFGDCTYVNGTLTGQTLSVEEILEKSVKLYPNPVKKSVNASISFGQNVSGELAIFDVNGMLVQKLSVQSENSLEIDTSALKSGIYFIQLITKEQRLYKKLAVI
ncbi:T9SS type A sorting domain-containing protein [Kordia sp. YSTF-M3]|uniref:T9SS type A sorting domain-containing protein n=1 Tax=Kordia aestuariivivens TaxID=2759037 RepID=A0ABR7Q561_9FLAO|nr:T9SS type A sorting domain-containing protein [Kordia aestuariivivens]MBC8753704.1 T9SS type A sorting domain-containing protein [Kordia aestuariivivens]